MARQTNTKTEPTLTPDQRAIAERVASQDTDWMTITEDQMHDFSLMVNPMNLKQNYPEAYRMQVERKFVFRWCEKTPNRVDELTRSVRPPLRWAIVNRQTLPELDRYVDPLLGCVTCQDQVLLFKPFAHAEIVNKAKRDMAEAKSRAPIDRVNREKVDVVEGSSIAGGDVVTYEDTRDEGAFVE